VYTSLPARYDPIDAEFERRRQLRFPLFQSVDSIERMQQEHQFSIIDRIRILSLLEQWFRSVRHRRLPASAETRFVTGQR